MIYDFSANSNYTAESIYAPNSLNYAPDSLMFDINPFLAHFASPESTKNQRSSGVFSWYKMGTLARIWIKN